MPPKRKALLLDESDSANASASHTADTTSTTTTTTSTSTSSISSTSSTSSTIAKADSIISSSAADLCTCTFWSWKQSEIDWPLFSVPDCELIETAYAKDPKSSTEQKLSDQIYVNFLDNTYHKGDSDKKTLKRCEMGLVWSWEKSRGEFYAFDNTISKKIEIAHKKGQSKVSIDTDRFINLSSFEQVRFDDESKTRRVTRSYCDMTKLQSPSWFAEDNGAWSLMADSADIETKYQYFLKHGKNVAHEVDSGKIRFNLMTKEENGKSVRVKRDNGPASALKKTYSQLSEEEKKELITQMLSGGVSDANKTAASNKKLKTDSGASSKSGGSSSGGLFLPGEEDIIEGDKPMKYILKPARHFDNSIADLHFRTAESQFYRLLDSTTSYKVSKVEYIVNPKLLKNFDKKKEEFVKANYPDCHPVFGFHGTASKNILSICSNNFSVPGSNGVKHATDSGWYGKGIYFSEFPEYSIGYISDCSKILLCKVLLGKSYKCSGLITGQPCQTGYTSHLSPDEKELVIFHPDQILPAYIVHYTNENATTNDGSSEYWNVNLLGSTNNLHGVKICLSGNLAANHTTMHSLISKHGGSYASSVVAGVTHVVTTHTDYVNRTAKVSSAEGSNIPVVNQKWLYDSIKGGLQSTSDYSFALKQATKKQEIKAVPLEIDDLAAAASLASNGATLDAAPAKPMCKYGATCYRKNAQHFKDFSHPFILD
ncbi:hypothetical protein SAMD00019534_004530 [Acytostelium subglobosum LB1]|uniref:hypothetical protein n=1 Tax=Acytostelium subglobosum LB1 TaxID=1410327 RepID=UPI0006447B17|nr:hypothetical protein SAMD00019534_004530 [Acytostelium subglobosum LB1]GAM17278.1 hypothetical protein SAMD00019534_004530 [Acytostelium subglobosum LB1]|eukprot:XP_012759340.1 hypothetical protein SAMD00019534_004530 [Acytostelium subglobosum LB1]